jgi:multidrug efflux system membrane fusion protein
MKPISLLALSGLLVLPAGCRRPPVPPPPPVVRVEEARPLHEADLESVQTYIGVIRGENETDLGFKVGGILELIGPAPGRNWGEGDRFEKDQVLARLVQVDFLAERDSAAARRDLAESRLARAEQLRRDEAISPQEYDVLKAARDEALAAYERARQAYLDSTLRAPFAGHILARLASPGETVLPGRPVLRIADLSVVTVELGVPDRLVGQVRPGQRIPVTVNSLEGRRFEGEVSEVGVAAKESSRLFKVVLKVPNPAGELRSGMTASVNFQPPPRAQPDAVLVRLSALVGRTPAPGEGSDAPTLAVFVVDETGHARERPVRTDDLIRSSVVITAGVRPGERVVVVGASQLHDGARVEARPWNEGARLPGPP